MADPLAAVARRVEDLAVGRERTRVDAEDGELAHVRVRDRLEHHRAERGLGVGGAPAAALVRGSVPSTSAASAGDGNSFTIRSSSGGDPDPARRRAGQDGHQIAGT